jgi:hypothetical protein
MRLIGSLCLLFAVAVITAKGWRTSHVVRTVPGGRGKVAMQLLTSSTGGMSVSELASRVNEYSVFLKDVACTAPPNRLATLLTLLDMQGEEVLSPKSMDRKSLNPFLIPLSRNPISGAMTCYIRWPTQKDDMDLQLVKTTDVGIALLAMGTDQYCHRIVAEMDFYGKENTAKAISMLNGPGPVLYNSGDYVPLLKSGKFASITEEDLRLVLDRFLLTKVGAFPDCFERLSSAFLKTGADVSALVTCERAVSIFYGWGHPLLWHANMLAGIPGRESEARDCARAAFGMPIWTVASNMMQLDSLAKLAGFTGAQILGEMHAFRANDPRTDEVGEGLSPCQVTLDQAAHLMDAVALGAVDGGWASARGKLADKYREGGYPKMADFILSCN